MTSLLHYVPTTTTNVQSNNQQKPMVHDIRQLNEPEIYRKNNNRLAYVDALVDANALVIESIWELTPNSTTSPAVAAAAVVPLRTFIQEVLKRSRTTYSTLQTALFYLFRSRPDIKLHLLRMQQHQQAHNQQQFEDAYISCGRRMFLASLVVASKFVQDKTYRNSAWAKIAGLPVKEINASERIFLNLINYRLYISQPTFEKWHHLLHLHVEQKTMNQPTDIKDLLGLPFAPVDQHNYYYHSLLHKHQQHHHDMVDLNDCTPPSPPYTPHYTTHVNNNHGWTLVLSPTTLTTTTKRKRNCYNGQQPPPPLLSLSLPSSINSSPMQTPTQISPVRMNNHTFIYNSPTTSFDHNQLRSIMNPTSTTMDNHGKKRKFSHIIVEPTTRLSYNISNVRQSKRFHL